MNMHVIVIGACVPYNALHTSSSHVALVMSTWFMNGVSPTALRIFYIYEGIKGYLLSVYVVI